MIRRLQKTDREQLIELLWEFDRYNEDNLLSAELKPFHEYKNTNAVFERDADEYISKEEFIVFVAEVDGKLVGYSTAKLSKKPDRVLDKEAYIEDWFVREDYRGQGLGEELFKSLIDEIKKRGCTHIKLDAFVSNKKAIDIYHKSGFIDETIVMYKKVE